MHPSIVGERDSIETRCCYPRMREMTDVVTCEVEMPRMALDSER